MFFIFLEWLKWQPWEECNCAVFQHSRFRQCKWDECNVQNETEYCTGQCPGEVFSSDNLKKESYLIEIIVHEFFSTNDSLA